MNKPGQRDKAILGSYTTAYEIAQKHGKACLDFIFSIITNAGWRDETNGYSKTIMKSLQDIWCAYATPELHNEMHQYFSKELREIDPGLLIAKARSKYPERDPKQTTALYLADMLIEDLCFEKSEYFEETNKRSSKKRVS